VETNKMELSHNQKMVFREDLLWNFKNMKI